jgi:Flp pilus assembly protein TadD
MDAVKRAASMLRHGDGLAAKALLVEARDLADTRNLRLRIAQLALAVPAADLAAVVAETVVTNHPGFAPALSMLAEARALQGRWQEAETAARRASESSPSLQQPWFVLGLTAAEAGRWVDADAHFTRALELGGEATPVLINRALVRARRGNRADALHDLDAARIIDPTGPAAVMRMRLLSEGAMPRPELAGEVCGTVVDLPVNRLSPGDLTQVLLAAARAGAPPCVDEWLMGVTAGNAEVDQIAAAYRAGVRGGPR